jgi:hypothetical protein
MNPALIKSASGPFSNWVPAPNDEFSLSIRAYWPKTEILAQRRMSANDPTLASDLTFFTKKAVFIC